MTITETAKLLQRHTEAGTSYLTVDTNEGRFSFTVPEAVAYFEDLAPGECFEIVTADPEIPETATRIFPSGALLLTADGTAYRASKPMQRLDETGEFQSLTGVRPDGVLSTSRTDDLPADVRVLWEPSGVAFPVHLPRYADRQDQISSALALLDDLAQDATDLGDKALAATLADAYHAVERFRILPAKDQRPRCWWPSGKHDGPVGECGGCDK